MNSYYKIPFALSMAAMCAVSISSVAQTRGDKLITPPAASASTPVPSLVSYSGTAIDVAGKPLAGETSITFLVYQNEQGGEPLFAESQTVVPNAAGQYKVQLGATLPNGLPAELFATGEARWLEVQIAGGAPQPRVLLTSVPYAMKAADAATFNGLPLSAFVLAGTNPGSNANATLSGNTAATAASSVTTTGGSVGNLAKFSGASTVVDSLLYDNGTEVGVGITTPAATLDVNGSTILRGDTILYRNATATAASGASSHSLIFSPEAFSSSTNNVVKPEFLLRSEPTGNNTASPAATLNFLYSNGTAASAETGLSINSNGTINFAPGQTFPGAGTGSGAITGVTAGSGLTGGGAKGTVTLNVDATKVPLLAASTNAFTGSQSVGGNLSVEGSEKLAGSLNAAVSISTGTLSAGSGTFTQSLTSSGVAVPAQGSAPFASGVNSYPLDLHSSVYGYFDPGPVTTDFRLQAESSYNGTYGVDQNSLNLLFGSTTQPMAETGFSIAANGALNAPSITTPSLTVGQAAGNVISSPAMVIQADDNGVSRTAAQQLSIQGATIPGQQLLIGYISNANTNSNGGLATIQATWAGYENTALALQPNGGCVCVRTGLNGALAYQNNPFVVGQGQGLAVADGWGTYSSRRFKTNIQTLSDALGKVERLRGVSYTLKATGKREIGVIAEEVGEVVPEVVTYEANGKDARAVDYNRLTALLIEATKQQQAEIASALKQIKAQQRQIAKQNASIAVLRAQVHGANESIRNVKQQTAGKQSVPAQLAMLASR
jgi:hypothetical protein